MKGRKSIQFRIVTGLLLILVVSLGVSIYITTANQKANLLDASQRALAVNNEMLNTTIRNIMLSGEAPIANRTMEDFRRITGFLEFELYRIDGSSAFNDFDTLEFVNDFQNRVMFDPTPRRDVNRIDSEAFRQVLKHKTPVISMNEETREMEYFFPILNYADCRVCHGSDEFIRGVSHFRISLESVYDQVSRAGTVMTLYFITVGIILFTWILLLMRRTIIKPVLDIGATVNIAATGNLDVQVDLDRNDEVGELAGRVNHMITGLRERRDLELQNKVIETRLEENRKYLDNIKEGLLLLNRERRITGQYSVYLTRLFQRDEIVGSSLTDFIYPDADRCADERRDLESFLDILFTNTTADMDMIMSINPLTEAVLSLGGNREIVIRADFLRIFNEDEMENVMVIFEDLTDIVRTRTELDDQKIRRESELEQIATILKVGPQVFEGFIEEAETAFGSLRGNLTNLGDKVYISAAFRSVHSVKGTARYLDFPKIEELSHLLEDVFAEVRDGNRGPDASLEGTVANTLDALDEELADIRKLIERFREFAVGTGSIQVSPFTVFSERVKDMVRDISEELDKEVSFQIETDLDAVPGLSDLQPSIFHLLRNALDHGVEDIYERL
ncbi:MAG: Hpt domain-containing protein, partial [Spirochaetaceae bacterium]|nr:Hpt domain-containing protein [Spirochaetaceae bacterium]